MQKKHVWLQAIISTEACWGSISMMVGGWRNMDW